MTKRIKASGTLGRMLAHLDENEMAKVSNKMLIAAKISNALRNKGMTQKEFAITMKKTPSEISEWLSGDRNFTVDTLTEISKALNIVLLNTLQTNCYSISKKDIADKVSKQTAEIRSFSRWGVVSNGRESIMGKEVKIC